jgi:uncharacterized repeat protein (TIGR02059 family)
MKANRAQLRAGRYKQKAEVWRFTNAGSDKFGQPISIWKKIADLRCFIDGTAGEEYFAGDLVVGKETFYLEFRHRDIYMRDQVRFIDKRGRYIVLDLSSVYEDEIGGRFIRALGYSLSADEQTLSPAQLSNYITNKSSAYSVAPIIPSSGGQHTKPPVTKTPQIWKADYDGDHITLSYNINISARGDLTKAFDVHIDGVLFTPTRVETDQAVGNYSNIVNVFLDPKIYQGQKVTIGYRDNIHDTNIFDPTIGVTNEMVAQTFAVVNGSTLEKPRATIDNIYPTVTDAGDQIILRFSGQVKYLGTEKTFEVIINGSPVHVTGISDPKHPSEIYLNMPDKIYNTDNVIVKYHVPKTGGIFDEHNQNENGGINGFTATIINNRSTAKHPFKMPTGSYDPTAGEYIEIVFKDPVIVGSKARESIIGEINGVSKGHPTAINVISPTVIHVPIKYDADFKKIYKTDAINVLYNNYHDKTDPDYKITNADGVEAPIAHIVIENRSTAIKPAPGTPPVITKIEITDDHTVEITFDQAVIHQKTTYSTFITPGNFEYVSATSPADHLKYTLVYAGHPFKAKISYTFTTRSAVFPPMPFKSLVGNFPMKDVKDLPIINSLKEVVVGFSFVKAETIDANHIKAEFTEPFALYPGNPKASITIQEKGSDGYGAPINEDNQAENAVISGNTITMEALYNFSPGTTITFKFTNLDPFSSQSHKKLKPGAVYPVTNKTK